MSIYNISLTLHTYNRWLVLISLIFLISYLWINKNKTDQIPGLSLLKKVTLIILDTQLLLGILLYIYSPIPRYFWTHLPETLKEREIRFFGLEHITAMITAVIVIHVGFQKSGKKTTFKEKHTTLLIWSIIGLIIILSSIPWSFSPLISRPNFR